MFITWHDEKETKDGTTRLGTVQTRGDSDDVFDVTMTVKPGNTHGIVGITRGTDTIVERLLVPLQAPNGGILASIRRHADDVLDESDSPADDVADDGEPDDGDTPPATTDDDDADDDTDGAEPPE